MRSKRHRRLRSHKLAATLIVLIVVVGLSGASDLIYGSLKSQADQLQASLTSQLQAGQSELEAGKDALKQANSKHDVSFVSQAIAHFATAKTKFLATTRIANESKLLRYLEYAPAVGDFARSRHSSVDAIAEMGVALSDAGHDLSSLDGQILKPPPGVEAGRTLLTVLGETHTGLAKVRGDLDRAKNAAALVNVQLLPIGQQATFLKARDSISVALAEFGEFERLVPVLTEVLGGNGPRTYLVEQVNPIELRAGGGFIGSYTLLRVKDGVLSVDRSGDSYELADPRPRPSQPGFIPLPGPYREVIPQVSWSFIDSNLFPDFPSNAKAAEQFVQPRLGKIDGVISIDVYAVAKMLELTGPMAVPGYGWIVDGSSFVPLVNRLDYAGDPAHKAILAVIAGPLMQRVSSLPADRWPALLSALNGLATERHLQAFFNNDSVETELDQVGWSGSLNLTAANEYMFEVEDNFGSKANYYLTRRYGVTLRREGGTLHHTVTVDFVNNTPYGSYARTYYHADVRLYLTDVAGYVASNLTPLKYANPSPPSGTRLLDGWVLVPCCGSHVQVAFEYDTIWPVTEKGPYQIYWQKQPGTLNDTVVVTSNGKSVTGDLGRDRIISLTSNGVLLAAGQQARATLPSLDLGTS